RSTPPGSCSSPMEVSVPSANGQPQPRLQAPPEIVARLSGPQLRGDTHAREEERPLPSRARVRPCTERLLEFAAAAGQEVEVAGRLERGGGGAAAAARRRTRGAAAGGADRDRGRVARADPRRRLRRRDVSRSPRQEPRRLGRRSLDGRARGGGEAASGAAL